MDVQHEELVLGSWKNVAWWAETTQAGKITPSCRGENGTDYFRPTEGLRKAKKRIQSDSCRIRSRIRLVINGYGKGYGFTNIRPYLKIYHISRLYPDNIRQNIRQWSCWVRDWEEKIQESYTFCLIVHKYHHARHKLVLYEYIFTYVEKFIS
jgi:hypothetical protein